MQGYAEKHTLKLNSDCASGWKKLLSFMVQIIIIIEISTILRVAYLLAKEHLVIFSDFTSQTIE